MVPNHHSIIISTHKASPIVQELTASKSGTRGLNSSIFLNPIILREIPTRISLPIPTAVVVALDNNDPHPTQPHPQLSTNFDEKIIVSCSPTPLCSNAECFYYSWHLMKSVQWSLSWNGCQSNWSQPVSCCAQWCNSSFCSPPCQLPSLTQHPLMSSNAEWFDYQSELNEVNMQFLSWNDHWQSSWSITASVLPCTTT